MEDQRVRPGLCARGLRRGYPKGGDQVLPQRSPRPRPQLLCGRGPTSAATRPGLVPPSRAQPPRHPIILARGIPSTSPPPPSIPDPTLTPSSTPFVRTADQVSWPPPHPASEDASPVQSRRPHRPCAPRKETHLRPGSGLQAPAGSSHAASFPPGIPSPRPPHLRIYLGSLARPSQILLFFSFIPFPRLAHF